MAASVEALEDLAAGLDMAYGACCEATEVMDVIHGRGTLAAIRAFAADAVTDG